MLTLQDIVEIKNKINCCIFGQSFHFTLIDKGLEGWLLQVSMFLPDCNRLGSKSLVEQKSGKYYLSPYATKGEVVQKCLLACIQFLEHEVRENFLYEDKKIFGPHLSLEALVERADKEERRK